MKKIYYGIMGITLAGIIYLINPFTIKKKDNYHEIKQNISLLETELTRSDMKLYKKPVLNKGLIERTPQITNIDQDKTTPYGNVTLQGKDDIAQILGDDCEGNCLYYTDNEGNVYRSKENQKSFYSPAWECTSHMIGEGYVLLDSEREVILWGKNNSDRTGLKPEEIMKFYCD